jgi:hypothetical protein
MPSARTRVVREPHRGVYDREAVYRILDEGFLCHIGFAVDGQPFVIPYIVRPPRRQPLHSWLRRQPHAAPDEKGDHHLHHRDPAGRSRARPLRFQSLHELPLGGNSRQGHAGRRSRKKSSKPCAHCPNTFSPAAGMMRASPRKANSKPPPCCACPSKNSPPKSAPARRRRRRRLFLPHLGGSRPAGDCRRTAHRRRQIAPGTRSARIRESLHAQAIAPTEDKGLCGDSRPGCPPGAARRARKRQNCLTWQSKDCYLYCKEHK